MKLRLFQVDAFTDKVFGGNPAAICPLKEWLEDQLMQKIAMENNLAETAFYVPKQDHFEIRWFTPTTEVDLCGHATLAAAYVLFYLEGYSKDQIKFISPRSGQLLVEKREDMLSMNFPADELEKISLSDDLKKCFQLEAKEAYEGKTDFVLVFDSEEEIATLQPELESIQKLNARGVIATAIGSSVDFVSRFFAPQSGINEDPVTGSAHTTLTPLWHQKTGKTEFNAKQLSARGGDLQCTLLENRVEMRGKCQLFLTGHIHI
ncbi:PhzF family phenazine biosynthesis protein [Cytophaga sp. FL35]|uniref:PhzF family phenazine biosynthesis protein n=1 Tax=Cytophaga sp. FL35 TaxID=1904456 RepID=UPI001653E299|nr:PhzF family phenazine biosynthesis protein [Cytophaga sp. FL35]MBC6997882.1 PhzF family phenazine biosynthesis protein [Cytophaga sp. FL35]